MIFEETELFKRMLFEMTGKTVEEVVNEDPRSLTPEHDASRRSTAHYMKDVRIYAGRFLTAKDIERKPYE